MRDKSEWSRRPLSSEELDRRYQMIMQAKEENRHASLTMIARMTGMTDKQVWYTLSRKRKIAIKQEKRGFCPDRPSDCGPCDRCISICPVCSEPIKRDQSYTKVTRDDKEVKIHMACKE